jgi:hypothetical protein
VPGHATTVPPALEAATAALIVANLAARHDLPDPPGAAPGEAKSTFGAVCQSGVADAAEVVASMPPSPTKAVATAATYANRLRKGFIDGAPLCRLLKQIRT